MTLYVSEISWCNYLKISSQIGWQNWVNCKFSYAHAQQEGDSMMVTVRQYDGDSTAVHW